MMATVVETGKLAQMVGYSLLAGVGTSVVVGLGVSSAAGLLDAIRERRPMAAVGWSVLATLCVIAVLAGVIFGIVIMTTNK